MTYVVQYDRSLPDGTSLGIPTIALVEDYIVFLAVRVATGWMNLKQARAAKIYAVGEAVAIDDERLAATAKREQLLHRLAREGLGLLHRMVNDGDVRLEDANQIEIEVRERWPWVSADDGPDDARAEATEL